MEIKANNFILKLDNDEVFDLCIWVCKSIEHSLATHYNIDNYHSFDKTEKKRLQFIKEVCLLTGNQFLFDDLSRIIKKSIEEIASIKK